MANNAWEEIIASASAKTAELCKEYTDTEVEGRAPAYATCTTAAATAAKVITTSAEWKLAAGSVITVKFTYTNTASDPTFNVNGTGAKPVWYGTAVLTTSSLSYAGYANRPMQFVYDGTQYIFMGWSYDSNTTYTNVKLGHGYATCSTAAATVAKVASLSSYTLTTGGIVAVKFTNAVPANATLNINSNGAKAIYHRGAKITAGVIGTGDTATFIYNGSYYHLISIDKALAHNHDLADAYNDGFMSAEHFDKLENLSVPTRTSQLTNDSGFLKESDKTDIVADVLDSIVVRYPDAHVIYGDVDSNNVITLNGDLADGTYTIKYENADGTVTEIGELVVGGYTNQIPISTDTNGTIYNGTGYREKTRGNSSGAATDIGTQTAVNPVFFTGFIPCKQGDVIRLKNCYIYASANDMNGIYGESAFGLRSGLYNSSKAKITVESWGNLGGGNNATTIFSNYTRVQVSTDEYVDSNGSDTTEGKITEFTIAYAGTAYVRLCLAADRSNGYTPADAIVTVNEEIE